MLTQDKHNLCFQAYIIELYCTQNVCHNHTIFIVEYCSKMDDHEGSEKNVNSKELYICHSLQCYHCLFFWIVISMLNIISDNVFKPDWEEQQLLNMTCTKRGFQFIFFLLTLQFLSILICHSHAKVQKGKLSHSHLQVRMQQQQQQ